MQKLILITNDDGIQSQGLEALAVALEAVGDVYVVAPDRERSACSHSLTITSPLRAEKRSARRFAVDGTPADCVNMAVAKLLPRRPDLVVSGINRGANLGEDVFYSGTVGGAREGVFQGVQAMAVSLATRADDDFGPAAQLALKLAEMIFERGLPEHTLLNVNVPPGPVRATVLTRQGTHEFESSERGRMSPRFWSPEEIATLGTDEISDFAAVRSGFASITPIHTDSTHSGALRGFKSWEADLRKPALTSPKVVR